MMRLLNMLYLIFLLRLLPLAGQAVRKQTDFDKDPCTHFGWLGRLMIGCSQ
jgi:hypothetical protein